MQVERPKKEQSLRILFYKQEEKKTMVCECGTQIVCKSLSSHLKTMKHAELMKAKSKL